VLGEGNQRVIKALEKLFQTLSKLERRARALSIPVLRFQSPDVEVILV
jgi:hypothetical protein